MAFPGSPKRTPFNPSLVAAIGTHRTLMKLQWTAKNDPQRTPVKTTPCAYLPGAFLINPAMNYSCNNRTSLRVPIPFRSVSPQSVNL